MIIDDLKIYIQHNFGATALNSLNIIIERFPRRNIEDFSVDDKNQLFGEIAGTFKEVAEDPAMRSTLRVILELQVDDALVKRISIYNRVKAALEHFWQDVDKTYFKYEIIVYIFCNRAIDAELQGLPHEDIVEIVNEALAGISKGLNDSFNNLCYESNVQKQKVRKSFSTTPLELDVNYSPMKLSPKDQFIFDAYDELWDYVINDYMEICHKIGVYLDLLKTSVSDTNLDQKQVHDIDDFIKDSWKKVNSVYEKLMKKIDFLKDKEDKWN